MVDLIFQKIHEDQRGSIHRILFKQRELLILFTRKGHKRGGDFHKTTQHDIVICGEVEFTFQDNSDNKTETLKPGDTISFMPNVAHMFYAKHDALVIEWLDGAFEKSYYPPYRRLILE